MRFRLALRTPRPDAPTTCLAEHVDPAWLKRHGYDVARSLGDADALWCATADPAAPLRLSCRSGHALTIEAVGAQA